MKNEYCPDKKFKWYSGFYKEAKYHYLNPERDKSQYKKLRNRLRRRKEKNIIQEELEAFDDYSFWEDIA